MGENALEIRVEVADLEQGVPPGVVVANPARWKGWTFRVDVDPYTWQATVVRVLQMPPKAPRNVHMPNRREREEIRAIARGGGSGVLNLLAAAESHPHRIGSHDAGARRAAVGALYRTAKSIGLMPERAISAHYGLPVDETGPRTVYSRSLRTWLSQAFGHEGPLTEDDRGRTRRWPGTETHSLAPRRAPAWNELVSRPGPYCGRILDVRGEPSAAGTADNGECLADVVFTGRWSTGRAVEGLMTLESVTFRAAFDHARALVASLEAEYPGAEVRVSLKPGMSAGGRSARTSS